MASSELLGALKRLEAALNRLEAAAAQRSASGSSPASGAADNLEVAALRTRIGELEFENQRLREAGAAAGERLDRTIERVESLLQS